MAVERCNRCDKMIDLDWNSEGIYIDLEFVCGNCLTDEEIEEMEG